MDEPMRIQITLKSGAQIEFLCDEMEWGPTKIKWTNTPDAYPRLVGVKYDEIAAVVRLT